MLEHIVDLIIQMWTSMLWKRECGPATYDQIPLNQKVITYAQMRFYHTENI